jgi:hypothetical protein
VHFRGQGKPTKVLKRCKPTLKDSIREHEIGRVNEPLCAIIALKYTIRHRKILGHV